MKILIVEDDIYMQKAISKGLKKFGYAVDIAGDGENALELFEINEYDAIILDLNLPKIDGIEVLKEIRKLNQKVKILILSARTTVTDKVIGFDTGTNDYLEKPFDFMELEARLRALLRRKFIQTDTVITHGEIKVDTLLKQVSINGNDIDLTKKEYGIFEYLILNKNRLVSAEEIIEHVWDSNTDLFSGSFKVHVNSLKKKIAKYADGKEIIKNTKGVGYYIVEV